MRKGKIPKIMPEVSQVSFTSRCAAGTGQEITCVTERCVLRVLDGKLKVTEIAQGSTFSGTFHVR
ncbi:hypothetical protein GKA01_20700 [Gluconobacter kanchanaburiensis NBRC 103587]|uniref:Uncharacterized protein n=2 Tax=Gluconobacter kanchanaburiensis TaxID=563199 RepID=A0A511BB68_9PROT|nr:hypothetical protein AA103587_2586 [Gluconobacter kanchanaburiensis NBRC 103587]GEK96873.1 hypothetical protein GKA01_20700 [Gluconobacter kanchanaburiensis NBRC 103587]